MTEVTLGANFTLEAIYIVILILFKMANLILQIECCSKILEAALFIYIHEYLESEHDMQAFFSSQRYVFVWKGTC